MPPRCGVCMLGVQAPELAQAPRRPPTTTPKEGAMPADNLVAAVRGHAERDPHRLACGFLADGERDLRTLSYIELDTEARRIADLIGGRLAPGSRAILVQEPGLDFIAA